MKKNNLVILELNVSSTNELLYKNRLTAFYLDDIITIAYSKYKSINLLH